MAQTRLADLISALSYGLDLAEGQPIGHAVRTALIGLRIAEELHLSPEEKSHLYYATLLKDTGCSSNASKMFHIFDTDEIAAKRDYSVIDWPRMRWEAFQYARHHVSRRAPFFERIRKLVEAGLKQKSRARELVTVRSQCGAQVARDAGFPAGVASTILAASEHWDGNGYPHGLASTEIPLLARILSLAQTLEVFYTNRSPKAALEIAQERSGAWFDPHLTQTALTLSRRGALFADLESGRTREALLEFEPGQQEIASEERIDSICHAFAEVIDAKSPYTHQHSEKVARLAARIASVLGWRLPELRILRRAALLHDVGKLSVPNCILEKPEKLDPAEWQIVRKHPYYTMEVLRRIQGFGEIAELAASHHEKLDGSGYYRNLTAERLPAGARILAVADIFDALLARRPYREAFPLEKACQILRAETPRQLDADCVEALIGSLDSETEQLMRLSEALAQQKTIETPQLGLATVPSGRMR